MAQRRMFSKEIVRSDEFLDLPATTQLLYFHFGMIADDDGTVASIDRELRYLGFGGKDDLKLMIDKGFIAVTSDGKLIFIIDWLKNNNLRSDRYNRTNFVEARLELEAQGYEFKGKKSSIPNGIPDDNRTASSGKDRLGKDRIDKGKESKEKDDGIQKEFSEYISLFIDFAIKNKNNRAMAQVLFLDLPSFQKEEAIIGAKNYIEWYKNDKPEDTTGQYSINAEKFLNDMIFTEWQKKPIEKDKAKSVFAEYDPNADINDRGGW